MSNKDFSITGIEIFCWIMVLYNAFRSYVVAGSLKEIGYLMAVFFFLTMIKLIRIDERLKRLDNNKGESC